MNLPKYLFAGLFLCTSLLGNANSLLIPMDEQQSNHLKAYGIAYKILKDDQELDWLLNYRGGSFLIKYTQALDNECRIRGVFAETISDAETNAILRKISDPDVNMSAVKLTKAAKIAVYSPIKISPASFENTDAVLTVLEYAEIPYKVIYDEEILNGELLKIDWLHLHHEDFTGQFGKNLRRMSSEDIKAQEDIARRTGYKKISQMKLAVAKAIKGFCAGGGYLFAMCSGAESLDVALAAEGVDIVESTFDGDGADPNAQEKLDFGKTIAFENFKLSTDEDYRGMSFSDINYATGRWGDEQMTFFKLFDFSAKWDVIPTMLTQNHEFVIREFFGQTTAFRKTTVKSSVLTMGESKASARYLYGELGLGQWTFYGGHDPEGVRGGGGGGSWRMPTDLNLHPHSPGYRLILNNVLFPSAKKKKRKT